MSSPFAEQLVALLGIGPGETVCALVCGDDEPASEFQAAVAPGGSAIAVDVRGAATIPAPRASVDALISLFAIGCGDAHALLGDAPRVLRARGRAGVLVWDASRPPAHLRALCDAARDAGITSGEVCAGLLLDIDALAPARRSSLRDVLRHDSAATMWRALTSASPVAAALATRSPDVIAAIRHRWEQAMDPFCAADGSLRVPVDAVLLS